MEATARFGERRRAEDGSRAKEMEKQRMEEWNCTPGLEIHRHARTNERVKIDRIGDILKKEDARVGQAVELLANTAKLREFVGIWIYVVPGELRLEEGHYGIGRKVCADGTINLKLTSPMTLKEFNEPQPGKEGLSVTSQVEAAMRDNYPFEIMSKEGGKIYTIEYMGADLSDLSYVRRGVGRLPARVAREKANESAEVHRGRGRPAIKA